MEDMLADFFTKLLQGRLFIKPANFIMGAEYANGDQHACRSVLDEVVTNVEAEGDICVLVFSFQLIFEMIIFSLQLGISFSMISEYVL